ncbi:hypothetical protein R2F61_04055 [Mollicutes bacterium LVI A0078]|nr:hypothetical protein RZE84_04075 [Mollicutes bacterium LVI A0075]WOO91735.1 hypothetical protein R2F61_04055 [Mollicutes bacterium LVI A0078]
MSILSNVYINTWEPSGDYGSEFKTELNSMKSILEDMIVDLSKYKKELDTNSENSKITKETIELVE